MHALAVVQGYSTFWFGKGHTGYKSFYHLPLQLGFDRFAGFLGGGEHTTAPPHHRSQATLIAASLRARLRLQAPLLPVAHLEPRGMPQPSRTSPPSAGRATAR